MKDLLRRLTVWAPPLLAAWLIAPFIIEKGTWEPWHPNMVDLAVYRHAAVALFKGADIYAMRTPVDMLPFIYPPIAAVLLAPFGLLTPVFGALVWCGLSVAMVLLILRRCGLRADWRLGLLAALVIVVVEPVRTTLGYGQINLLVAGLVIADLLPHRAGTDSDRPWPPRGLLLGVAIALKLTPLIFVALLVLWRRWFDVAWAVISAGVLTLTGALLLPGATARYWAKVSANDMYGDPRYIGNQSLSVAVQRWLGGEGASAPVTVLGFALCAVALWAAMILWRHDLAVLAVGVVGLASCLASPITWSHHHVWVLPALVGLVQAGRRLSMWVTAPLAGWLVWLSSCPVLVFWKGLENLDAGQRTLGVIGPVWGAVVILAFGVWAVRSRRPVIDSTTAPRRATLETPAEGEPHGRPVH